jgi:phage terminase large subunit-like protein
VADYLLATCAYCGSDTWCETRANGKPQCRGCKVEKFFECVLYPPLRLQLLPWQRKVIRNLYGTLDMQSGLRQFRRALIEVPKKNGKSFLVGGLPIYHLLMEDTEIRPEAFGAAAAKEQAGIVFKSAAALVRANPELLARLRVVESTKRILRRDGNGGYTVLSADGDVNDGIEPSLAIIDELHRWKSAKAHALYTVVIKGMISRREPLAVQITTAGAENESPIWSEEHDYALQMSRGGLEDKRFYFALWAADEKKIEQDKEYWKSREARVLANPSHEDNGGFLKDDAIVDELKKAVANPVKRAEYLRFHLNIRVSSTQENAIDMMQWRSCGGVDDLRTWPAFGRDELNLLISKWGLADKPCYAGVDLSWTTDMTGLVLWFPPKEADGIWKILPFAYAPAGRLPELTRKTKRHELPRWAEQGFIEATPGDIVDIRAVKDRLRWAAEMFELREVAFDPWNFKTAAAELVEEGIQCIEIIQGFAKLSEPTKKLIELYVSGRLQHGNHPVFNWHASCLALQGDRKDNVQPAKPERDKSGQRVDLMSAAITGMNRAMIPSATRQYTRPYVSCV